MLLPPMASPVICLPTSQDTTTPHLFHSSNNACTPSLLRSAGRTARTLRTTRGAGGWITRRAVPSSAFRELLRRLAPLADWRQIAWASKGFEQDSGRLLHEVLAEELGSQVDGVVVSGPSFAAEVPVI